jgi:hypothetical protein
LIAKQSEKIIFLEAELCKAHEHEIMAERNASNEMYGGINQKSQSTSYAAPTASSLAKGGPSTPALRLLKNILLLQHQSPPFSAAGGLVLVEYNIVIEDYSSKV